MAQNIGPSWRDENGQFQNCQQLLKVSRLGPKAFEQCAGFLRINYGRDNPLDASTVHPEAYYPGGGTHSGSNTAGTEDLMGNSESELRNLKASDFTDENSVCRQ